MNMSDRDKDICRLIEQGCKGTKLAIKYDISRSRVYQIYKIFLARKHEEETSPPLKKLLTVRMRKAMMYCFKDDSIYTDPARIMSISLSDYRKYQNVGKYALESLVNGMIALGYVENGDKWLEGMEWLKARLSK